MTFIVMKGYRYEGESIDRIYDNLDEAIKYIESLIDPKTCYGSTYDYYAIYKRVGETNDVQEVGFREEITRQCNFCKIDESFGVMGPNDADFTLNHKEKGHDTQFVKYTGKILLIHGYG